MACRTQVQDGEPAKSKPHLVIEVHSGIVRTPVREATGHPVQDGLVRLATTKTEHCDKPTHSRVYKCKRSAAQHPRHFKARRTPLSALCCAIATPVEPEVTSASAPQAGLGWSRSCLR